MSKAPVCNTKYYPIPQGLLTISSIQMTSSGVTPPLYFNGIVLLVKQEQLCTQAVQKTLAVFFDAAHMLAAGLTGSTQPYKKEKWQEMFALRGMEIVATGFTVSE